MLVVDEGRLVGIFTERDALFRVVARASSRRRDKIVRRDDARSDHRRPRRDVRLCAATHARKGFRHTPVVENGRPVGVVSACALDPDLEEFAAEAERRKHIRRRA